jgi:hypothetical protein
MMVSFDECTDSWQTWDFLLRRVARNGGLRVHSHQNIWPRAINFMQSAIAIARNYSFDAWYKKAKCLKWFPSKLNWLPETQSMNFVSPTSVTEGLVSCKYSASRCMKPTACDPFHRCTCRASVHGFLSYWLLPSNRASINLPMLEITRWRSAYTKAYKMDIILNGILLTDGL